MDRIDYVEFVVRDIARTKAFYGAAFGWEFTDYGPEYASFSDGASTAVSGPAIPHRVDR